MFISLPCQHIGLYYGHHNVLPQLYIEDHGSLGLESNSVEAIDACKQHNLCLWYWSLTLVVSNEAKEILARAGWTAYFTKFQPPSEEIAIEFLQHL